MRFLCVDFVHFLPLPLLLHTRAAYNGNSVPERLSEISLWSMVASSEHRIGQKKEILIQWNFDRVKKSYVIVRQFSIEASNEAHRCWLPCQYRGRIPANSSSDDDAVNPILEITIECRASICHFMEGTSRALIIMCAHFIEFINYYSLSH